MKTKVPNKMLIAALCNILANGLLKIRESASLGNIHACKIEADHLHNIPSLIRDGNIGLLKYYYTTERNSYLKLIANESSNLFDQDWAVICQYLEEQGSSPITSLC